MEDDSLSMGTAFSRWQHLTDEYAQAVAALQRGDQTAHASLARIACAMRSSVVPERLVGSNPNLCGAAVVGGNADSLGQPTGPEKSIRSAWNHRLAAFLGLITTPVRR